MWAGTAGSGCCPPCWRAGCSPAWASPPSGRLPMAPWAWPGCSSASWPSRCGRPAAAGRMCAPWPASVCSCAPGAACFSSPSPLASTSRRFCPSPRCPTTGASCGGPSGTTRPPCSTTTPTWRPPTPLPPPGTSGPLTSGPSGTSPRTTGTATAPFPPLATPCCGGAASPPWQRPPTSGGRSAPAGRRWCWRGLARCTCPGCWCQG